MEKVKEKLLRALFEKLHILIVVDYADTMCRHNIDYADIHSINVEGFSGHQVNNQVKKVLWCINNPRVIIVTF